MQTKTINLEESLLGEIVSYYMPYPDLYYVSGRNNEGYAIPLGYSGGLLSTEALSFGIDAGDCRYFFTDSGLNVVEYEVLGWRLRHSNNRSERAFLSARMEEIRQFGQVETPEYFGEYPPPNRTPMGIVERIQKIENGIYYVRSSGEWLLGVCGSIWETGLTIFARQFGQKQNDYVFYDLIDTCAVPLFELMQEYPAITQQIESMDTLYQTLWESFPGYVAAYNHESSLSQEQMIPRPDPAAGKTRLLKRRRITKPKK